MSKLAEPYPPIIRSRCASHPTLSSRVGPFYVRYVISIVNNTLWIDPQRCPGGLQDGLSLTGRVQGAGNAGRDYNAHKWIGFTLSPIFELN